MESISDEAPCGVDLEYDNDFARLEFLFLGEQETQMGDSVIEAQEPNWDEIVNLCESLLGKSKDLNLLVYFCVASLEVRGILGLSESIQLLKDMVVRHWDHLYPQLDMDEPEDQRYIGRINLLENLSKPFKSFGDPFKMVERIRNLPISDSKQAGRFSLAHMIAAKENKPMSNGGEPPALKLVEASFQSSDPNLLKETAEVIGVTLAAIGELEAFLVDAIGTQLSANFKNLKNELEMLKKMLGEFVSGTDAEVSDDAGQPPLEEPSEVEPASTAPVGKSTAAPSGAGQTSEVELESVEIRTRERVTHNIDRILAYYQKYEPGSPIPLLLRRAKRLMNLDFEQLVGDLTPSGKSELKVLIGNDSQDEENSENTASG